MAKQPMMIAKIHLEMDPEFSLEEFCEVCHVSPDFIREALTFGILEFQHTELETHHFNARELRRMRTLIRLQQDLEVNVAGAALAIELMEEMDRLRTRLNALEKFWETK